ncbi:MAG: right-handed parallel beta-helix repeat-containing protein [Pirellulaceae bacterium]
MHSFISHRIILALLISAIGFAQSHAASYYVRKSGNDSATGLAASHAFRTIAKAASVSGNGDTIYIGAGTYDEYVYLYGPRNGITFGTTSIVGDQKGKTTGDKGEIIVRSMENSWGLYASAVTNLSVSGITFDLNSGVQTGYGCYIANGSGTVNFNNCVFKDLQFGLRTYGLSHSVEASDCTFMGGNYAVYTSQNNGTSIRDCSFNGSTYGAVVSDSTKTIVKNCSFSDTHPDTGVVKQSRDLYLTRTALTTSSCKFVRSYTSIYGTEITAAKIDDCTFSEVASYCVDLSGESMKMSNSTVSDGNYGVTMGDTTGGSAKLSNVTIQRMYIGVMAHEGDYDFDKVTLAENYYAIYQQSGNALLTLTKSDTLTYSGNEHVIYTNHPETVDATLKVSGQDFGGNKAGVYAVGTRVDLRDCKFAGEKWGAYCSNSPSVDIRDCTFDGNVVDPYACTYGIYVKSPDTDIRDTTSRNARYGICIDNTATKEPVLKNLISEDHAYAALYLRNGNWTYSGADNNVFRNSDRGVMASNLTWRVVDVVSKDDKCNYPIMDYYGNCNVTGATVQDAGKVGFYSYQSQSIDVSKLNVSNCGTYGIYIHDCDKASLDSTSSTSNQHGIYCYDSEGTVAAITNSIFSSNKSYGMLLSRVSLDPTAVLNLTVNDNYYGISVHNQPFEINPTMKLNVSGNRYGFMSYYKSLDIKGMKLGGNEIAAYAYDCDVSIESCSISGSSYGLLAYPTGKCQISDSSFSDGAYGIYVRPFGVMDEPIKITNTKLANIKTYGIYVNEYGSGNPTVQMSDLQIANSHYGLVTYNSTVSAQRVTLDTLTGPAIYCGAGVNAEISDCIVNNAYMSWGILTYGDDCSILRTTINNSVYGIGLYGDAGSVVNTVVNGSTNGIYMNKSGGNYSVLHTTVANSKTYGLLHYHGDAIVRNSIFDAASYGIYDVAYSGVVTMDHNLVYSPNRHYGNTQAGTGDINKDPIFVDRYAGNVRLAAGSPAINSGIDVSGLVSTDMEGNARPSFRAYEMGAYEYTNANGSLRVLDWDEVAR